MESIQKNINLQRLIKGKIRYSVLVENKILASNNQRICLMCREIFTKSSKGDLRCRPCEKIRGKEQRAKHKEREQKRRKAYYEANKERLKAMRKQRYKELGV